MLDFVLHAMKLFSLLVGDHVLGRGEIGAMLLSTNIVMSLPIFHKGVTGLIWPRAVGRSLQLSPSDTLFQTLFVVIEDVLDLDVEFLLFFDMLRVELI